VVSERMRIELTRRATIRHKNPIAPSHQLSTRIPRFEVAQALPRLRFQGFAARSPRIKAIPGKSCGVLEPQWRWRMGGFQSRSSGSIKNHPLRKAPSVGAFARMQFPPAALR
jgi:hypothetical protein